MIISKFDDILEILPIVTTIEITPLLVLAQLTLRGAKPT